MNKYMKKNKGGEWDQKLTRVVEKAFTNEVISSKTYEYLKEGYSSQQDWQMQRDYSGTVCEMYGDDVHVEQ